MMEARRKKIVTNRRDDTVAASEIANWVFCHEAWRLDAIGHKASNQPERDGGTAHHVDLATTERIAGGAIGVGIWMVLLAMLAIVTLLVLGR